MAWLVSLIGNISAFFCLSLAKKTLYIAAAIASSIALTVALSAVIQGSIASIVYALPTWAATGAMFLPSNLSPCIAALISAKFARFVYDWNMRNLEMAASIN